MASDEMHTGISHHLGGEHRGAPRRIGGRHLTTRQVATLLGRSQRTVRCWIRTGVLPAVRRPGGWAVPVQALQKVVELVGPVTNVSPRYRPRPTADIELSTVGYDDLADVVSDDATPDREAIMPIDFDNYMTLSEAAEYVRRSSRTVRRWVAAGLVPGALRLRQQLLVPKDSLDTLFEPACADADAA